MASQLTQSLHRLATRNPNGTAFEFLNDAGHAEIISYGGLLASATMLGEQLLDAQGEDHPLPVVLICPPGLDFVSSLFACLLAGCPAVPLYPPSKWRPASDLRRLNGVISELEMFTVISSASVAESLRADPPPDLRPDFRELARGWIIAEHRDGSSGDRPLSRPHDDDEVALVQYTSGSTKRPRGVLVKHKNLDANLTAITKAFDLHPESRSVIWLPPYHDMGLIGGLLSPVFVGYQARLMSPLTFINDPGTWLRAISECRATVSGGPNFAYDLCVRRKNDDALAGVDLKSWTVAFNGAEPVRASTLRRFATAFGPYGFDRRSFFPCYGLAEATLLVTTGRWNGSAVDGNPDRVSCGVSPAAGNVVRVVHPEDGTELPAGSEGEIVVSGPSVTDGYWPARVQDAPGETSRDLPTGDRGLMTRRGELVVLGRAVDVLVWRGQNYHAADVEAVCVAAVPEVRVAAAFEVQAGAERRTVVVAGCREPRDSDGRVDAIREAVLKQTGLLADEIVLVAARQVPRTPSGKVMRAACRERYLLGAYELADRVPGPPAPAARLDGKAALADLVAGIYASVCDVQECAPDVSFLALGGDSLRAGQAASVLSSALGIRVDTTAVLERLTPIELANEILGRIDEATAGYGHEVVRRKIADITQVIHDGELRV